MKIEFECPQCRSTLRLDAVHGGHQALCPVCGNAVMVPTQGNRSGSNRDDSGWQPLGPGNRDIEFRDGPVSPQGSPLGSSPVRQPNPATPPSPWTPPISSRQPVPANYVRPSQTTDGLWTMGLICGIVSLVMHVLFCGCGSFLGPLVAIAGFCATLFSRQGNKTPLLILNGIGLVIGLIMLGTFLVWMTFAN